jgi:branched-chain amino acid transport system ATP-binding protein
VLHLGKVLAEGTPDEIRSNPVVVSAYLGSSVE